ERKIVADRSAEIWIARYLRHKVQRVLGEASFIGCSVCAQVAKYEGPGIADAVMLDHVQIDVQAVGTQSRHATLELFALAETRFKRSLLVLGTDVIIIKWSIAVGAGFGSQICL